MNLLFSTYGVGGGSQNDTNLLKPRTSIISKLKIEVETLWKVAKIKNQTKSRSKKERKAQSFKTKQQEVLLSGNTLGF